MLFFYDRFLLVGPFPLAILLQLFSENVSIVNILSEAYILELYTSSQQWSNEYHTRFKESHSDLQT